MLMMASGKVGCPGVEVGRSRSLQRRLNEKEGAAAWAALALGILLYDAWAIRTKRETMSITFGRWLQSPGARKVAITTWAVVSAHLLWSYPLPFQSQFRTLARWNQAQFSQLRVVTEGTNSSQLLVTEQ